MPLRITLSVLLIYTSAFAQKCHQPSEDGWSASLRDLSTECGSQVVSPNRKLAVKLGENGTLQVASVDKKMAGIKFGSIETPAMVSWSPKSDAFFIDDGQGSGLSSVLRIFRVTNQTVAEDDIGQTQAVAIFRQRKRCSNTSLDPNVWAFGWSNDGALIYVLIQATPDDSCGKPASFITAVFRLSDEKFIEILSEGSSRKRFQNLLPESMFSN